MKMPEKHDLLAAILAAKEQGIGAILAFAMAYLRGRYNRACVYKALIDASYMHIYRLVVRLYETSPIRGNLFITSMFIGYIGTDSIGSLIKRPTTKAEVEDGRNQ